MIDTELNLSVHTDDIGQALTKAWATGRRLAHDGQVVVDEITHLQRFNRALSAGTVEPGVSDLHHEFIRHGIGRHTRDEWIAKFRAVGFRGVFDRTTVMDSVPDDPLLLFRLAEDYSVGLSWAGDARYAHSRAWLDYRIDTLRLWCAVVPPEALLGVAWFGPGVNSGGRPLWRTVDTEVFGRVTITLDDFAEYFVAPMMLDTVAVFDTFTRTPSAALPVVPSCMSLRSFPSGRIIVAPECKPDGCGAPDGCRAVTPTPLGSPAVSTGSRSWFRGDV